MAGIIGWIVLGVVGKGEESDLRKQACAAHGTCAQSDVDAIKTKYVVADVSLGLGIAGLGAGVALFILSQPKRDTPAAEAPGKLTLDVRTGPGLGYASVATRF